jgi:hypothetical protein
MKGGYLIGNWLQSQLRKRGVKGMKRYLAEIIGGGLAGTVTDLVVKGAVTKAVSLLGGKLGAIAGPIGVGAGLLAGWL